MQPSIMITNGGDHPAEKWADVTADHVARLIQVEDDKPEDSDETRQRKAAARRAKARFELDLADVLLPHHSRNQVFERGKLDSLGDARIAGPFSTYDQKEAILAKVEALAASTPFAEHFALPLVQEAVGLILDGHFAHVKHCARRWHAHRNPEGDNAKAILSEPPTPETPAAS